VSVADAGTADGGTSRKGSLLHLLDRCSTAAGSRLIRRWLARPLADRSLILERQQAVQVTRAACLAVIPPGTDHLYITTPRQGKAQLKHKGSHVAAQAALEYKAR
jgi:hypothetical protein